MNNTKRTFLAIGFMFFGLLACNSEQTTEQTTVIDNPSPSSEANEASEYPPLSSIPESTPVGPTDVPIPESLKPTLSFTNPGASLNTAQAATSTARLNPAHGQPGHDCGIPVGSPLKGSVAAKAAPATEMPVAVSSPLETKTVDFSGLSSQPKLDPNVKINPAHGQPGHDCSVGVGEPLPVK